MEFEELQKNWDAFGKRDPLWAILTEPEKRNNQWDLVEFFRTGEGEIAGVMEYIDSLNIPLSRNRALDFGCGVGRLTQALCHYFEQCSGVDIARSMIELAQKYNRYGSKCRYYVNEAKDLRLFEDNSFDFIYSSIVLQHMKAEYSKNYIKEFIRVLAVDGLLIFQLPSEQVAIQTNGESSQSLIDKPLPESAFKAQLIVEEPFTTAKANSQITINVKVKNTSDITWPARGTADGKYEIRLGNHWLNQSGKMLMNDDARASLLKDLKPMEEASLPLTITTPVKAGTYILELDLVQEMVSWFKDKGLETIKLCIDVDDSDSTTNPQSDLMIPQMEMYGVNKDSVIKLVASNKAEIVDIQEDHSAGPSWSSFRYCVRKSKETRYS